MRLAESRSRAMNNSAGAGQDERGGGRRGDSAELAASTSARPNADRDDAMSTPDWRNDTLNGEIGRGERI